MQMVLTVMAVVSAHTISAQRQRRAPQYIPIHSIHDDLHNQITGLTYDIHNRIAASAHYATANALANSAYAFSSNSGPGIYNRYPYNGNTYVQAFGPLGQQGLFISTFSGGSGASAGASSFAGPSSTPVRLFTSSIRPATGARPATSARPATPARPASVLTSSLRPASSPSRPIRPLSSNSILTSNSGRPLAAASAGLRPGGGVSASAAAVSTSG